jgi:succinoglycan biosynthesis transport protein ExoP
VTDFTNTNDEIDLRSLFGVLRRQIKIIVFTTLAAAILALVYLFSVTPKYTATALISIEPNRNIMTDVAAELNNATAMSATVDGEIEILKSNDLIKSLVAAEGLISDEEFGLQPGRFDDLRNMLGLSVEQTQDPDKVVRGVVGRVADAISASRRGLTYLIQLSFTSESPEKAAKLVNALAKHYIQSQVQKKIETTLVARDIIAARVVQAKEELELAENQVDGFLGEFTAQYIDQTRRPDLMALENQIAERNATIEALEQSLDLNASGIQARDWNALDQQLLSDASRGLIRQRDELNAKLNTQQDDAELDIDALRAELAALDDRIAASAADDLSATRRDISAFRTERDEFEQNLRGEILNSDLPPGALTDLYQLQQEGVIARSQYQDLLQRLRQLDSMSELQVADASIVSTALEPSGASFPNKRLTLALGLVLGAMLGTGLGLLNEFVIGGVVSEDQLADLVKVPQAVGVPALSEEKDSKNVAMGVITAPMSGFAESFRQLKHALESQMIRNGVGADGQGKVILVTSAVPFEGKTTTSVALARTLAMAGNRVVLVDFDLRKPSISERLDVEPNDSLLKYLSKELDFESLGKAYGEERESGLSYLVGGGRAKVPTDALISSPRAKKVFEVLREGFDYVIIDSAPVLPVVDTLYLAPYVDAVVMGVRFASTSQRDVTRAYSRITNEMNENTAFLPLLTMEEGQRRKAYYYRGYYHGYGQRDE